MPDKDRKSQIADVLLKTRDARLLLEAGCWVHDLDKASWPFLLYAFLYLDKLPGNLKEIPDEILRTLDDDLTDERKVEFKDKIKQLFGEEICTDWPDEKYETIRNIWWYQHEMQPERSQCPEKRSWLTDWLLSKTGEIQEDCKKIDPFNIKLLGYISSKVKLFLVHNQKKSASKQGHYITPFPDASETPDINFFDAFNYHSAYKDIEKNPWAQWMVSAAIAGPDGIDSEYFKRLRGSDGMPQRQLTVYYATPFGLEMPVLDVSSGCDLQNCIKIHESAFLKIWSDILSVFEKNADKVSFWDDLKKCLKDSLSRAVSHTNRPANDATLWAHSHGVGAMAKTIAAAVALDAVASADKGNESLIFPLRSPELHLFEDNVRTPAQQLPDGFFTAPWVDPGNYEHLQRQVQTKFKVLSVLIRDIDRLHVGRKVGDILGYHQRRDDLFSSLARAVEQDLAAGTEIFRDHAGIHFIIPWCQDSPDPGEEMKPEGDRDNTATTQETLEQMLMELTEYVFGRREIPDWFKNSSLNPAIFKDDDFDPIISIAPARESIHLLQPDADDRGNTQGLLFLKDTTRVTQKIDRKFPGRFPGKGEGKAATFSDVQLCPVCRKQPATSSGTHGGDNDRPCAACLDRRQSRVKTWWHQLCTTNADGSSTIWSAEVSDRRNQVSLITLAFDLKDWFDGTRFEQFLLPKYVAENESVRKRNYDSVHPVPARIRGVWETTMNFLETLKNEIGSLSGIGKPRRLVFECRLEQTVDIDKHVLIEENQAVPGMGDWLLNVHPKHPDRLMLLNVSGYGPAEDEDGKMWLARNGRRIVKLHGENLADLKRELADSVELATGLELDTAGMKLKPYGDDPIVGFTPMVHILTDSPTRFQVLVPGESSTQVLEKVHDLFDIHFGKTAHLINFSVNCLTFKEKFPFYLALEASDRFVRIESARAGMKDRKGVFSAGGLLVNLAEDDPAIHFFEREYSWKCMTAPGSRDPYRSTVRMAPDNSLMGWSDASGDDGRTIPAKFTQEKKYRYKKDNDFSDDKVEGTFKTCCPRLSWAHLASPSERYREQLSIPLLGFKDWMAAYQAPSSGFDISGCTGCIARYHGALSDDDFKVLKKHFNVPGLSGSATGFRNVIEEILDAHARWPSALRPEKIPEEICPFVRSVLSHPNGCRPAWGIWAAASLCPVLKALEPVSAGDDTADGQEVAIPKTLCCDRDKTALAFIENVRRFECMACRNEGESLCVTFDLLHKICGL